MALEKSEEQNFNVVIRLRPPSNRELNSEFDFENIGISSDKKSIQIRDFFNYIPGSFAKKSIQGNSFNLLLIIKEESILTMGRVNQRNKSIL
jgi:hypothetical protein